MSHGADCPECGETQWGGQECGCTKKRDTFIAPGDGTFEVKHGVSYHYPSDADINAAKNRALLEEIAAKDYLSKSETELVKLLKKLDPWNSGFWKIHLEEVKQEYFQRGYDFSAQLNINNSPQHGIEIKDSGI